MKATQYKTPTAMQVKGMKHQMSKGQCDASYASKPSKAGSKK